MEWKEEKKDRNLILQCIHSLSFFIFFKPFVFVSFPRKTVEKIHETGKSREYYVGLHSI